jgi:hypothetical protein
MVTKEAKMDTMIGLLVAVGVLALCAALRLGMDRLGYPTFPDGA